MRAVEKLTNKRQPQELQPHERKYGEQKPQNRLDVEREPEEATVGWVDRLSARLAALEDPLGVARLHVHLVPPPQSHESTAGNVLEIVEVGREKENGDDEDHDPISHKTLASISDGSGGNAVSATAIRQTMIRSFACRASLVQVLLACSGSKREGIESMRQRTCF